MRFAVVMEQRYLIRLGGAPFIVGTARGATRTAAKMNLQWQRTILTKVAR